MHGDLIMSWSLFPILFDAIWTFDIANPPKESVKVWNHFVIFVVIFDCKAIRSWVLYI